MIAGASIMIVGIVLGFLAGLVVGAVIGANNPDD